MKNFLIFMAGFFLALMMSAIVYFYLVSNTIILTEDMTNKQLYCELFIFEDSELNLQAETY